MHIVLMQKIVDVCRQRSDEGDCSTVSSFGTEMLENCIIQLDDNLIGINAIHQKVMAELETVKAKRDALQAKLDEMEKQLAVWRKEWNTAAEMQARLSASPPHVPTPSKHYVIGTGLFIGCANPIIEAASKTAEVIVDCSAYGVHRHKVFKNSADHAQALARLTELMALDPKEGSKEDDELEILALVIEDYERNIAPPVAPKPDAKRSSTEQQTRQSAEP